MRGARPAGLLAALVALAGAAQCTYSPDPESGTLECSVAAHQCPEGYMCGPANTCLKNSDATGAAGTGTAGTGAAGIRGTGGTGGAAGHGTPCAGTCTIKIEGTLTNMSAPVTGDNLIGKWIYDSGSKQTVTCTDGSTKMADLANDYVDVQRINGTLTGTYFCQWTLTTGPAGTVTMIRSGQSCTRDVMDATTGTTRFTWHGTTFTFTSLDDRKATLASMIGVEFIDDPTKTGCTP